MLGHGADLDRVKTVDRSLGGLVLAGTVHGIGCSAGGTGIDPHAGVVRTGGHVAGGAVSIYGFGLYPGAVPVRCGCNLHRSWYLVPARTPAEAIMVAISLSDTPGLTCPVFCRAFLVFMAAE